MNFTHVLLLDSIRDHLQEFKELYKLAETISKSEGSLDVLARKVNKLVEKDNIFLLDPLVRWVIAAECLSSDEEFFKGLGEAVKKRKGKTTPHGSLELKRLKLVVNAIMDAHMAKRKITPTGPAERLYVDRCASCHGRTGRGDGPATVELWAQPPNFQDAEWQQSVGDERIEEVIVRGGEALGSSRAMPAHPDLADQPEVVASLREYVRSFGQTGMPK